MRPLRLACCLLLAPAATAQLVFVDVAAETNTQYESYGRGSVMVDFDGDGLLDIAAAVSLDQTRMFRQLPDRTFEDATATWSVPDYGRSSWGFLAADFDNDADPDLMFANGGFLFEEPNDIFRNDVPAGGGFVDVTALSGLETKVEGTFGATALDYDRDGDIDVFYANNTSGSVLLRNDGGLVFADVTVAAGITPYLHSRHCGSADYDNDGWPDVGVGKGKFENRLWHNEGDGTFVDVAEAAGVSTPDQNFGFVFEDFDNDGWLDVFVPKYQSQQITTVSRIFMNQGDGTFVDVSAGAGMAGQTDMGHNVGDMDADGFPEIYIGTGHPAFESLDVLYRTTPDGNGGIVAQDLSATSGIWVGGETRCHGMALGDYDEDGDIDVYVNNGGPQINELTKEENYLLQNQGNANGWLKVDPVGVLSPRTPVGLKGWVDTTAGREVHRTVQVGKGFANTSPTTLHFGVGTDPALTRLTLLWPSGIEQVVLNPPLFDAIDVVETGLRLRGEVVAGGQVQLDVAGPDGDRFELFLSGSTTEIPLPKYGGVLYLQPPLTLLVSLPLGPGGEITLPLSISDDPILSGLTIPMQAWIHAPGANKGGTLSNLVEIAIP